MSDWKAKEAARAVAANALRAANPHLWPANCKGGSLMAAAKNIRLELAAAFPGVKFSVKSSRYSGGDSIDVKWSDGPNCDQVNEIIGKYQAGHFDGMVDCYEYQRSAWRDAFGDAKYIGAHRDLSDAAIASVIRQIAAKYGDKEMPSVEQFRAGNAWRVSPFSNWQDNGCRQGNSWQDLIHQVGGKKTWAISKAPKARELEAEEV